MRFNPAACQRGLERPLSNGASQQDRLGLSAPDWGVSAKSVMQVSQLEGRLEAAQAAAGEAEERAASATAEAEDLRVSSRPHDVTCCFDLRLETHLLRILRS